MLTQENDVTYRKSTNPTESWLALSILWEHFCGDDTGNGAMQASICVMILVFPLLEFGISLFRFLPNDESGADS